MLSVDIDPRACDRKVCTGEKVSILKYNLKGVSHKKNSHS